MSLRSVLLAVVGLLPATGCGFQPGAAELAWGLSAKSRAELAGAPQTQSELALLLEQHFGTPADPRFPPAPQGGLAELKPERRAALERDNRAHGLAADHYPTPLESAESYRVNCLHCHGAAGAGDGPTAASINPKPRDFRKGIFKWAAVKDKARPRREDLATILENGVYGTAMHSFARLRVAEIEGLVDHVRLLSVRGEVEALAVNHFKEEDELDEELFREHIDTVWTRWQRADSKFIAWEGEIPSDSPAMRARGRELYLDARKGNCVQCHGDAGKGDGPAAWKINAKGKKELAYLDDWGFAIQPRDLTQGIYRGGARPIDIYRRIHAGINGGPMPGIGETKNSQGGPLVSSDDLWALVHYVRSIPEGAGP
jgi:mono/diheme cytochrome c family protein